MAENVSFVLGGLDAQLVHQLGSMANRHGLIAGATGTGKTVSLQILAEGFSRMGVPVFATDVKGDLSGLAAAIEDNPKIQQRLQRIGIQEFTPRAYPSLLWDLFGEQGHPVRTTVSELGPLLLSNLLELNETQEGVVYGAFQLADDQGLLLLELEDLEALLAWMAENANELQKQYGNITRASVGAIQRRLLVLKTQGAENFFGEPALELRDLMHVDFSGNGVISILEASRLLRDAPRVYSAFLLWLLAELFEQLPERGDQDKPVMVLFFDEAHLIFDAASKALLEKIEQVVRLIRSKGVGVYFVTQSPLDVPDDVLGQLGLKIQHALRAFTPKDRKAIAAVAENFVSSSNFNIETALTDLATGEALISALDEKGRPQPVVRALVRPPESRIGPLSAEERQQRLQRSPIGQRYDQALDRDSAFEMLQRRVEQQQREAAAEQSAQADKPRASRSSNRQTPVEAMIKSAARAIGSQIGRQIFRGVFGSLRKGR